LSTQVGYSWIQDQFPINISRIELFMNEKDYENYCNILFGSAKYHDDYLEATSSDEWNMTIQIPWDKLPKVKESSRKFFHITKFGSSIHWDNRDDFEVEFCYLISLVDEDYAQYLISVSDSFKRRYGRAVSCVRNGRDIEGLPSEIIQKIENGDFYFNINYARLYSESLEIDVNSLLNECAETLLIIEVHDDIIDMMRKSGEQMSYREIADRMLAMEEKGYTRGEILKGFFMCKRNGHIQEEKITRYSLTNNEKQKNVSNFQFQPIAIDMQMLDIIK
jgi:hypothetical protein